MTRFRTMSHTIKRHMFRIQQYFSRQPFSYSAIWNTVNLESENKLEFNNKHNHSQNKKLLKVAMLGLPNVGKSTLVNRLMQRSICPTSSKVHTTMHKAEAVYIDGDAQIIFVDTPGLVQPTEIKQYKLSETFVKDPQNSTAEADVIGIIQDVTSAYTRHKIDNFVIDYIKNRREDAQLLLILNKVDMLKKKEALLDVTRILTNNTNYPKFNDIFMVSAYTGDGVDDLRNYLLDAAKIQDWKYEKDQLSDQPLGITIQETVRAKLMDLLPFEMPYKIKVTTEHLDFCDDGSLSAVVTLDCPATRYKRVLLKGKAHKVKCLSFLSEKELSNACRINVLIRINIKCAESK